MKLQNLKNWSKNNNHRGISKKAKISSDCRVERRIFNESTENGYSYYGLNDGGKTLESQGYFIVA